MLQSFLGRSKAEAKTAEGTSQGRGLHEDGAIECLTCGTSQPYTRHLCMECGADPWAPSAYAPLPSVPNVPPVVAGTVVNTPSIVAGTVVGSQDGHATGSGEFAIHDEVEYQTGSGWVAATVTQKVTMVGDPDGPYYTLRMKSTGAEKGTIGSRLRYPPSESSSASFTFGGGGGSSAPSAPPMMSPPPVELDRYAAVAEEHAECSVCFEPLCHGQLAVFAKGGKRVCYHFFHATCARALQTGSHGDCPLCRAPFQEIMVVPKIAEDPQAWFQVVDMDGDGDLNAREVFEVLKAQFPIDYNRLEQDLPQLWRRWDPSMDGKIQKHEFLQPKTGLLAFVQERFVKTPEELRGGGVGPPPDVRKDKRAWFAYFDEDNSGELSQAEVVRGLIKSFHLGSDLRTVQEMKDTVEAVWCMFDEDNSGEIDMQEFLKPDEGLADSLAASFATLGR